MTSYVSINTNVYIYYTFYSINTTQSKFSLSVHATVMLESHVQLITASYDGKLHQVQQLLTSRAITDVNWRGRLHNETALIVAACNGHTTIVQELLQYQADVNAHNKFRNTALHKAAMKGLSQTVAVLLEHPDININATNSANKTPLYWASMCGHQDCVQLLLEAHADTNIIAQV